MKKPPFAVGKLAADEQSTSCYMIIGGRVSGRGRWPLSFGSIYDLVPAWRRTYAHSRSNCS